MNNTKRISLCNEALEANKVYLSSNVYNDIFEYINTHNEWGIGIEMLIDILCEEDKKIDKNQFLKIHTAMDCMDLGESDRIEILKKQITNGVS